MQDLFKSGIPAALDHDYLHYSEVPTLSELYDLIRERNKLKRAVLEKRKLQEKVDSQRNPDLGKVVKRSIKSHDLKKKRDHDLIAMEATASRNLEIQQMVEIARTESKERTEEQCMFVRQWLWDHTSKDSIISTFFKDCDEGDALELCRGLQYQIFMKEEAIIRQGAYGMYHAPNLSKGTCSQSIVVHEHIQREQHSFSDSRCFVLFQDSLISCC